MACLEVEGGSSSSHGHTDTDTGAFSAVGSSQGQTEHADAGARLVSAFSVANFVPSLWAKQKNEKNKEKKREEKNTHKIEQLEMVNVKSEYRNYNTSIGFDNILLFLANDKSTKGKCNSTMSHSLCVCV